MKLKRNLLPPRVCRSGLPNSALLYTQTGVKPFRSTKQRSAPQVRPLGLEHSFRHTFGGCYIVRRTKPCAVRETCCPPPQGFKTVMEIDTVGVFNMSSAAFPALKESGAGAIINISMTLHYGATWFQAHASAAKAAIDSLTR